MKEMFNKEKILFSFRINAIVFIYFEILFFILAKISGEKFGLSEYLVFLALNFWLMSRLEVFVRKNLDIIESFINKGDE